MNNQTIKTYQNGNFINHYKLEREARLFYGVEIEFDGNNPTVSSYTVADNMISSIKNSGIEAYHEGDGSLYNGREVVVHPCTYSVLEMKAHAFIKAFRIATNAQYTNNNQRAGGHIHVTRRALGKSKETQNLVINKMISFLQLNKEAVIKFSGRDEGRFNQWSAIKSSYVYPTRNDMRERYPHNRYQAINLCNSKTVEFRIFNAWTDINSFLASVQFVKLLVKTAKAKHKSLANHTLDELIEAHAKNYKELAMYWRSL